MTSFLSILLSKLGRLSSAKGFGVQSPYAFSFLHDVIRQKLPYYAYENLTKERINNQKSANSKKIDELLFRLSNFVQPSRVVIPFENWKMSKKYLSEGCKKATITEYADTESLRLQIQTKAEKQLVCLQNMDDLLTVKDELLSAMQNNGIVVVMNIYDKKDDWQQLLEDNRISVSFDLYGLGILIFVPNVTPGRYKANIFV